MFVFSVADLLLIVFGSLVLFVPGLLVLIAGGVDRGRGLVVVLGAAPAVTIGVAYLASLVSGALGVTYGPVIVAIVTVLVSLAAWFWARRSAAPAVVAETFESRASQITGIGATVVAIGLAVRTWGAGLGHLGVVPQEHDMVLHTAITARIARTGEAAPWQSFPADYLTGSPDGFYPTGSHAVAALLADFGAETTTALNALSVAVFAVALPLGLLALGTRLRGVPWGLMAGGAAAIVAAFAYRPVIALMHDGGIFGNGVAIALAPGLIAVLVSMKRETWPVRTAAAIGVAGLVAVHTTSLAIIGIIVAAWILGDLLTSATARAEFTTQLRTLLYSAGIAGVLLIPVAVGAADRASYVTGWPRDFPTTPMTQAIGVAFGMPYGGFLDLPMLHNQALLAALVIAGVVCCLVSRTHGGLLLAWLAWTVVLLLYLVDAAVPLLDSLTGLFYNSYIRISGVMAIPQWLLAGVAVAMAATALGALGRQRAVLWRVLSASAVMVLLIFLCRGYDETNAIALQERYRYPHFWRVDDEDLAAFEWLSEQIGPGERVMNNANDGSTYGYVFDGLPVVNTGTLGNDFAPYTIDLLSRFDQLGKDPEITRLVDELNIAYVFYDAEAPGIGVADGYYDWAGSEPYTIPPGFAELESSPWLEKVFERGSVTIFKVDPALRSS